MLRRLAYVSRPRDNLELIEISRIIAASRSRNPAEEVSGVLVFTGLGFAQLIEGEDGVIGALWTRIQTDARHTGLVVLTDEAVRERWFTDWRVGFPTDSETVAQLEAWRERCAPLDEEERSRLRRLLAACDAA